MGEDGPRAERAVKRDHAGRTIGKIKRHPFPGPHPFPDQGLRELVGLFSELAIGDTGSEIMDGRAVGILAGDAFQKIGKRQFRVLEVFGNLLVVG